MMIPRVSIVIPTYNQAHYLREALESVRAQTMADWEAIVVNNHSDDDTVAVATSFADPRIQVIDFHNHGIIAAARNQGLSRARAEWVAFLDSDDAWTPDKLERSLAAVGPGVDVLGHAIRMVRDGVQLRIHPSGPEQRAEYRSLLFDGSCATPSASLVRRTSLEAVGGMSEDPAYRTAEDYELWLKLAAIGARFKFIPDVLTHYRVHQANASGSVLRHRDATVAVVADHFARLVAQADDCRRYQKRLAMIDYGAARSFMAKGATDEALEQLAAAWRRWPGGPRINAAIALCLLRSGPATAAAWLWVAACLGAYLWQFRSLVGLGS